NSGDDVVHQVRGDVVHAAGVTGRADASALAGEGHGKPLAHPRGRALWPKAIPLRMRFHDLRHGFATELLRRAVDGHRVQRLMRHSDVRATTGIYGHLIVEDLRAALEMNTQLQALTPGPENANPNAPDTKFAAFLLQSPKNSDPKDSDPAAQAAEVSRE